MIDIIIKCVINEQCCIFFNPPRQGLWQQKHYVLSLTDLPTEIVTQKAEKMKPAAKEALSYTDWDTEQNRLSGVEEYYLCTGKHESMNTMLINILKSEY